MLQIIGYFLLFISCFFVFLIIITTLFIKLSPVFGGKVSQEQKARYRDSPQFRQGKFAHANSNFELYKSADLAKNSSQPKIRRQPKEAIPFVKLTAKDLENKTKQARFTWFGHSTFLVEIDGKNILIDPMFSPTPSPIQAIGRKRYTGELPLDIKELPPIDAVLITHDHYDHLDYKSIIAIKNNVKQFFCTARIECPFDSLGS